MSERICNFCGLRKPEADFHSAIVDGVYVPERCGKCFAQFEQPRHSEAAAFNREKDQEDHLRDIIQPYLADGITPNPEFIHAYPVKAKELYFTPEQLEDI